MRHSNSSSIHTKCLTQSSSNLFSLFQKYDQNALKFLELCPHTSYQHTKLKQLKDLSSAITSIMLLNDAMLQELIQKVKQSSRSTIMTGKYQNTIDILKNVKDTIASARKYSTLEIETEAEKLEHVISVFAENCDSNDSSHLKDKIKDLENTIAQLKTQLETFRDMPTTKSSNGNAQHLQSQIESIQISLNEKNEEIERLKSSKTTKIFTENELLREEIDDLKKENTNLIRKCNAISKKSHLNSEGEGLNQNEKYEKIAKLNEEISMLRQQLGIKEGEIDTLSNTLDKLKDLAPKSTFRDKELQVTFPKVEEITELQAIKIERDTLLQEIELANTKARDAMNEYSKISSQIHDYEENENKYKEEISKYKDELQETMQSLLDLKNKKSSLLVKFVENCTVIEAEIQLLMIYFKKFNEDEPKERLSSSLSAIQKIEQQFHEIVSAEMSNVDSTSSTSEIVELLKQQIIELKQFCDSKEQQLQAVIADNEKLHQVNKEHEDEIRIGNEQMLKTKDEISLMYSKLNNAQSDNGQLKETLTKLKDHSKKIESAYNELKAGAPKKDMVIQELMKKVAIIDKMKSEADKNLIQYQENCNVLKNKIESKEKENDELITRLRSLEDQFSSVENIINNLPKKF